MKIHKIGQDYQGFYSGDVPEQALGYLGTSVVDSSQVNAVFGKANEAINLVNRFNGSLLLNISFVFNFSKGGAYGVYLSELDRAIKTKALKKQLEQKGYEVRETQNGLTAFPKKGQEKSSEEIQKDIDQLYAQLQSKGGTAIGVNVASVLNAAKMDAAEVKSPDPDMWQWIALLHLGGTIVHEAVHAQGHMDEGPSEAAEESFVQWALPQINEQYRQSMESAGKGDQFAPLTLTGRKRHAKTGNWYKTAQQLSYYVPRHFIQPSSGSDLSGRFPTGVKPDGDMSLGAWSMMAQTGQDIPIESRLGRQFMSPLPNDLSQEHDILEEQLRKYTREDKKLDPKASMNELLSEGYDENRDYITLEGLLEEKRPKPLMVPLKKNVLAHKVANVQLKITPFMAEELAIDFENYEEHFDDNPNNPEMQEEKVLYEKFKKNDFNFTDKELIMIGESLIGMDDKDVFTFSPKARKQLFDIELQLGMWTPITDERAKEYVRNGLGVRMSHFPKVNGVRYDFNNEWDNKYGHIPSKPVQVFPKPITEIPDSSKTANTRQDFVKTATLFGWMNNLQISDGSTIPGLGDRVMAWEDRDEDFSEEESWIKHQPRYNPEYDIKGFYYRWIEPRFRPQTFDDMTRDVTNTHPAKRFASSNQDNGSISKIYSVLSSAKSQIAKKEILATRFIVTEDVIPIIDKVCQGNEIKINVFHFGETDKKEEIYAVWLLSPEIGEEKIEKIERHLQNKSIDKDNVDELIDGILGISKQKENAVQEVFSIVKIACKEYGFKDIYIVGSYPRDLITKTPYYLVENLDFAGGWASQNIKLGSLVAEKLGISKVNISNKTTSLSFVYKDIRISFNGDYAPTEVKVALKNLKVPETALSLDVCNRDFTINMLAYDINTDKIVDVSGLALKDVKNKIIKTFLDPNYVCQQNPIIILRAIKLKIRYGYDIDRELQGAMMKNADLLFDGRYLETDLIMARENVKREGKKEAEELFKIFRLDLLEKIK